MPRLVVLSLALAGCSAVVTSDGTETSDGSASSGSGGAGTCAPYADSVDGATPVTIRVTNATADDLFFGELGRCDSWLPLEVVGPDGALDWQGPMYGCGLCRECGGCYFGCVEVPARRLPPGSTLSIEWAGTTFDTISRPASCTTPACEATECLRESSPAPGGYAMTFTAHTAVTCSEGSCTCVPSAAPVCEVPYAIPAGEIVSASATWSGESFVDVVFR